MTGEVSGSGDWSNAVVASRRVERMVEMVGKEVGMEIFDGGFRMS